MMSSKRKLKHEYIIMDKEGIIVSNYEALQDIYGSKIGIHDIKNKNEIKTLEKGYHLSWAFIEDRYNELNERYIDIKKRIELISLIRMKRDETYETIEKTTGKKT